MLRIMDNLNKAIKLALSNFSKFLMKRELIIILKSSLWLKLRNIA